jgi:hypothetical protein
LFLFFNVANEIFNQKIGLLFKSLEANLKKEKRTERSKLKTGGIFDS